MINLDFSKGIPLEGSKCNPEQRQSEDYEQFGTCISDLEYTDENGNGYYFVGTDANGKMEAIRVDKDTFHENVQRAKDNGETFFKGLAKGILEHYKDELPGTKQ